jgi:anti-sigma-K factor RskA
MSFASLPNPAKIALATTAAIATAVLGYSVYFDHRRRHDPVFRNKLSLSTFPCLASDES